MNVLTPPANASSRRVSDTGLEASSPKRQRRIPRDEWEAVRSRVTQLYRDEKRSLKDVMEVLERETGFTATMKMFKSRIYKWGLDKKLKSDEVLAMMVLKRDRDAVNKDSEFTIRGQRVDPENVQRYIKRHPPLVARFQAGEVPSVETMLEVRCETPQPCPQSDEATEPKSAAGKDASHTLMSYIEDCLGSDKWIWEYDAFCTSRKSRDRSDELFERILIALALVNRCMMRGDEIPLASILDPAFDSLQELVASESPLFAVRTLCLLWCMQDVHSKDLFRLVLGYAANLVPTVLGEQHPMARLWKMLAAEQVDDYHGLSESIYSSLVPFVEKQIGSANFLTTMLYGDHIDCVFHSGRSDDALALAERYISKVRQTQKHHPWLAELDIAHSAIQRSKEEEEEEAELTLAETSSRELTTYVSMDEQLVLSKIELGNCYHGMEKHHAARASYAEAARLAVAHGVDERLLQTALANLESALGSAGMADEAATVRRDRLRRLAGFAEDAKSFNRLKAKG